MKRLLAPGEARRPPGHVLSASTTGRAAAASAAQRPATYVATARRGPARSGLLLVRK